MIEKKERFTATIELLEPMLGTVPKDPEVYKSYIASKAPEAEAAEEEIETVEKTEEKGWTGFHRDDAGIFIYNYMIKGFLKSACEVCMEAGAINKIPAYKKWIDLLVFVEPRKIHFDNKTEPDGCLERPLRTMTMQGPRVTVCRSDYVEAGTRLTFDIEVLKNKKGLNQVTIEQMLDYGQYVGLGQWRGSGGYGRFKIVEIRGSEGGEAL